MFTHATPSASSTLEPTTSPAPHLHSGRSSRLRGLSYLRNYTHSLHSSSHHRDNSPPSRRFLPVHSAHRASTTSSSLGTSSLEPSFPSAPPAEDRHQQPSRRRSTAISAIYEAANALTSHESSAAPSGWLPTVGSHSGASSSPVVANSSAMPHNIPNSAAAREPQPAPQVYGSSPPPAPAAGTEGRHTIRFSQHQDARAPRPSLVFSPMGRTLPTGTEAVRVGRYSERETQPNQPANLSTASPVGFKSKVVSRRHCEFWQKDGVWYIRDMKSSSGTFLNHVRLSSPGTESRPFPVRDGDLVQLGIDFKGGEEMIFRCVKIRVELDRPWQAGLNNFK